MPATAPEPRTHPYGPAISSLKRHCWRRPSDRRRRTRLGPSRARRPVRPASAALPTSASAPARTTWRHVVAINLDGLFHGLKYRIPAITGSGGGAIVNVSSVFADRGGPTVEYSSAEHAIRGLTAPPPRSTARRECVSTDSSPA
ncbi:SDR family NAD(P)-dependent oxidoreductase [Streptomyces sp. NBC_01221]